jgi:hypothetical protein
MGIGIGGVKDEDYNDDDDDDDDEVSLTFIRTTTPGA